MKSINKLGGGRVSAVKLSVFFNYLHDYEYTEYNAATNKFTTDTRAKFAINLKNYRYNHVFYEIAKKSFQDYWTPHLLEHMHRVVSLENIVKKLGSGHISSYLMDNREATSQYIEDIAHRFTKNRELISFQKINGFIFGGNVLTSHTGFHPDFIPLLKTVAKEEYEIQKQRFVSENQSSTNISSDLWVVYYWQGASFNSRKIDFSEIQRTSMQTEVKYCIRHRFSGTFRINTHVYSSVTKAINIICAGLQ